MVFRISKLLSVAAVLAVGLVAGVCPAAYAANDDPPGTIRVHQTFKGSNPAAGSTFEYCLEAHTANAPMPSGAQGNKHCFTMTGNATHKIQLQASASAPYKSEYSLYMASQLPKGYKQSEPRQYRHEVYSRGGALTLLTFDNKGTKVEDPVFTVIPQGVPTLPSPTPSESPSTTPPTATPPTATPPTVTPPATTPPTPTPDTPPASPETPGNPVKPPVSTLVRTGATISFGTALALLLAGGLFLSRRRAVS